MSSPSDKAMLRRRLRALRRELAAANPDAAGLAAGFAPLHRLAPVVASYHAEGSELDPGPAAAAFAARGASIALPVGEARDRPLIFRKAEPGAVMARDAFGVLAPDVQAPRLTPGLIIVPLLAFDRHGGRLGQGAGAYDRTIAKLRAAGEVFVLGLAYAGQEIDQAPDEAHDQRLDGVLTETGYREFR